MKTLHKTLGTVVLLGTVSISAYAQTNLVEEAARGLETVSKVTKEMPNAVRNTLTRSIWEAQTTQYREIFPDMGVGIRNNEELTVAPLDFVRSSAGDAVVRDFEQADKLIAVKAGSEARVKAMLAPKFVPFEPSQKVSLVGMKEFFSATPAQSPRWVGLFGLNQCVGVAIVSKQGPRVLRVSVAHVDGRTQIGEGQSDTFFKQAVDPRATTVDVYLLADNHKGLEAPQAENYSNPDWNGTETMSPWQIVRQIKERLEPFSARNIRYHEQLAGVPQFAVNTATGQLSMDVAFPRDLNWTPENEIHFNRGLSNVLVPAELAPSPAMEAVSLRQRYPQNVSGPVRQTFPEEGVEIANDADLTLRPIGGTQNTPVTTPKSRAPWMVGTVFEGIPNAPIREYFPGMGYILDDADGTFVPER